MEERINKIIKIIDDKKGIDIEKFDLTNSEYFVDAVIISTIMVDKHGYAILDDLKKKLKPSGEQFLSIEESNDWIVIDLGDILIHLMSAEYRDKYQLEEFLKSIKK